MPNLSYEKGELIANRWRVLGLLGTGGFGEVYLVENVQWQNLCALKTIRSEYIGSLKARESFKKEALLWLNLGEHEFIVTARWVEEVSGRLLVVMDYIAPDQRGRVTLSDHLDTSDGPLETDRILKWGIQFCYGMEHAHRQGIKCHQDIKPSNILIDHDDTLKISDFGLAQAAKEAWQQDFCRSVNSPGRVAFSFSFFESSGKRICGTLGYIAPELFLGSEANTQSDIYSFGLVLWQMATGNRFPPFFGPSVDDFDVSIGKLLEQQLACNITSVGEPLQRVIDACLAPKPHDRFRDFKELRNYLELAWLRRTGSAFFPPEWTEQTSDYWMRRGSSLHCLGRTEEAITCFANALELDPQNAAAWNNKGLALKDLGQLEEGLACFSKSLEIDPKADLVWSNKGAALHTLAGCPPNADSGQLYEALLCFEKATHFAPENVGGWINKGILWQQLGDYESALASYTAALKLDPRNTTALYNMAHALYEQGRSEEAISFYERILEIDPLHDSAWNNIGMALLELGNLQKARDCFSKAVDINPNHHKAWGNKGCVHLSLNQLEEAIACYDQELRIQPKDATAWSNKGVAFNKLGRPQEALVCFNTALDINPDDAEFWFNMAQAYKLLGNSELATESLHVCIEVAEDTPEHSQLVLKAKEDLQDLEERF